MREGLEQFAGCQFPEQEKILLDLTAKYQEGLPEKNDAEKLKTIIDEIGWPTISKVGIEATSAAWLIAEHADHDKDFQMKCLELMKAEPVSEIPQAYIAQLEARLNS